MVTEQTHYTVPSDTDQVGPDGTPYQFKAGDKVPMAEAIRLGFVTPGEGNAIETPEGDAPKAAATKKGTGPSETA